LSLVGLRDIGGGTVSGMLLMILCVCWMPYLSTMSEGRGVAWRAQLMVCDVGLVGPIILCMAL
jgi:hypothetical protein